MKRKVLGRDALLASSAKLKKEPVELADGIVYVRELSGRGLLEYNERIEKLQKEKGSSNPELTPSETIELAALLVSKTACDAQGNLLFTEEDINSLMDNSMGILLKLSAKAMELSGLSKSIVDEVTDNLKNARKDSSTTD